MNEDVFKDILAKAVDLEFAEFDNAPEHKFRLKHRLAMKRVFAEFDRNARKLRAKEAPAIRSAGENDRHIHISLKQRLLFATLIVILMTFLAGWVVIYTAGNFSGTVCADNTHLTVAKANGSPQTIECKYALASVPNGFELTETDSSPIDVYTVYMDRETGQTIVLRQWVKSEFEPHYNTERRDFEKISINGGVGLCIDLSGDGDDHSIVIWDNGDYVFDLMADLDKNAAIDLIGSLLAV